MNRVLFLVLSLVAASCQKEKSDLRLYKEVWLLNEVNSKNQGWEPIETSQKLNFYFKSDSTLRVETDSLSCDGTYEISLVNNGAYPTRFKVFAPCITPASHMWWTFQSSPPTNGLIEVIPRLNPTAYLIDKEFRFRLK